MGAGVTIKWENRGEGGGGGGAETFCAPPPSGQVHNCCASPFNMVNMRHNEADIWVLSEQIKIVGSWRYSYAQETQSLVLYTNYKSESVVNS